jgi:hypothetical protein
MNNRRAGEDFYFLQHLSKTSGIGQVKGTVVYPSPRSSHRVPFGTGRTVSKGLAGDAGAVSFYHPDCFRILEEWLSLAAGSCGVPGEKIQKAAESISPILSRYLFGEGFLSSWERISRVKKSDETFLAGFHEWFDGLRTMKLIHQFSAESLPRCGPEDAVAPLLAMAGFQPVAGVKAQLELLRKVQS